MLHPSRWNLICQFPLTEEAHNLLKVLVLFQFDKQAEKLQLTYDEALQMMEAAVPEVWPEGLQTSQAPVNIVLIIVFNSLSAHLALCISMDLKVILHEFTWTYMNPKYTKRTFYEREQLKGAGHPAWDKGTLFGGFALFSLPGKMYGRVLERSLH